MQCSLLSESALSSRVVDPEGALEQRHNHWEKTSHSLWSARSLTSSMRNATRRSPGSVANFLSDPKRPIENDAPGYDADIAFC
jgi:type IV secretory pathway TraG/TraD family ATPase VirD4